MLDKLELVEGWNKPQSGIGKLQPLLLTNFWKI